MNSTNNTLVVSGTYINTLSAHNNSNNNRFYFQYNFNLALLLNSNVSIVFSILCTNHYKILFNPYFFQNYLTFAYTTLHILKSYIIFFKKNTLMPRPFLFALNQRQKPSFGLMKKSLRIVKSDNRTEQALLKKSVSLNKTKKLIINNKTNREIHVYKRVKKIKKSKSLSALIPWRQYFKFLSKRRERLFTLYVFKAKRFKKFSGLSYHKVFKKFRSRKNMRSLRNGRKHILLNQSYKFKRFRSRMKLYTTLEQYTKLSQESFSLGLNNISAINTQYNVNTTFAAFHSLFFNNKYKVLTPLLRVSPKKFDVISQPLNVTNHYNWRKFHFTKKARKRLVFLTLVSKLKRDIKINYYLNSPKLHTSRLIKIRRKKILTNKRRKYSLPRQYHFLNGTKPSFMKFRPMKTTLLKRMIRFYKRNLIKIKNTALKGNDRRKTYKYTWKNRTLLKRSRKDLSRLLIRSNPYTRLLPIKKLSKLVTSNTYLRKRFTKIYIKGKFSIFLRERNVLIKSNKSTFRSKFNFKRIYLARTKIRYLSKIKRRIYRVLRKTSLKYSFSTLYYTQKLTNRTKVNSNNLIRFGKNVLMFPLEPTLKSYRLPRRLKHYRHYKRTRLLRQIISMTSIRVRTKSLFLSYQSIPKLLTLEQFILKRRLQRQLKWQSKKRKSIFGVTMEELTARDEAVAAQKRLDEAQKLAALSKPRINSMLNNLTRRHLTNKLSLIFIRFRSQLSLLPLRRKYKTQRQLQRQNQKKLKSVLNFKIRTSDNTISETQSNSLLLFQSKIQGTIKPRFKPVYNSKFSTKFSNKLSQPVKEPVKPVISDKPKKVTNKSINWYKLLFHVLRLTKIQLIQNKFATKSWKWLQSIMFRIAQLSSRISKEDKVDIFKHFDSYMFQFLKKFRKSSTHIWKNPNWKQILRSPARCEIISNNPKNVKKLDNKFTKVKQTLTQLLNYENPSSLFRSTFFLTLTSRNLKLNSNLLGKVYIHSNHLKSGLFLHSRYKSPFILSHYGFLFIQTMRTSKTQLLKAKINKHRYSFFYKNDIKKFYLRNTGRLKLLNSMISRANNSFYAYPFLNWRSLSSSTNSVTNYLSLPKENTIATGAMSTSSIGFDLINARQQLFVNPLIKKTHLYNHSVSIKRIKFKPGYSRIWRRSREAINFSLNLNLRYQYRLTRCLNRLQRTTKGESSRLYELTLLRLLLNARFVLDLSSSSLMLQNQLVFVNGSQCSNQSLYLFKGDFIQLAISLKYYIVYRWLYNYNFQHKLRLHKLSKSKANKSRTDLSKQKSFHLPDWIFLVGYRHYDIPRYMEVDYFTLSAFILYDHILLTDYNPLTFLESRNEILNMYNWKYTV